MAKKEMVRCPQCGEFFERTRPDKKYCSPQCKAKRNNKASAVRKLEIINERGIGCPHNDGVICTDRQCGACGWNPVVAERRLKNGILR